jgi:hypothetical protein
MATAIGISLRSLPGLPYFHKNVLFCHFAAVINGVNQADIPSALRDYSGSHIEIAKGRHELPA